MYLSIGQCEQLDGICNRFEVALRTYVSLTILEKLDEQNFKTTLDTISSSLNLSTFALPINVKKISAKAKSLHNLDIYKLLINSKLSFDATEIKDGDVISVGELTSIILLFYNPFFMTLSEKFTTLEQFNDLLTLYHSARNLLAHPASAKITQVDVEQVLFFISGIMVKLNDSFFWYCSKNEITKLLNELTHNINRTIEINNNFNTVPKKHMQLLMREQEMSKLIKLICGENLISRTSGSVELHGYGGVGKTALALEFCYEIFRRALNHAGDNYNFLLWLTSKTEELTHRPTTGELRIVELEPNYRSCNDIIERLKLFLGFETFSEEQLLRHIYDNKLKGLIVLDNLETLDNEEKEKIKKLIKRFPPCVQFIITSRNYEEIADDSLEIRGFSDSKEGRNFIKSYCKLREYSEDFEESKLDQLIKDSCGNTLILVLSIERIISGVTSLDTILEELKGYKESEIEIIADFMYKNTFESAIKEIEKRGSLVDVKKLLIFMLIYQQTIDFHSLRELLNNNDSRELEAVIGSLINRFVIVKNGDYYELHDFAYKFVRLKFLPDKTQLKEYENIISDYKRTFREMLKKLYEDKNNYSRLEPILNDWKVVTETETIAIAHAYSQFDQVKKAAQPYLHRTKLIELLERTKETFKTIETRSNHPYIRFQKARVLRLFFICNNLTREQRILLNGEITQAYDDTYFSIKLRHSYLTKTESYAAFLWKYGMHLFYSQDFFSAVRILEESVDHFSLIDNLRNRQNPAKANNLLALAYARVYLVIGGEQYLNRIRGAIIESSKLFKGIRIPDLDSKQLELLLIFTDVFLNTFRPKEIRAKLSQHSSYNRNRNLEHIYKAINQKIYSVV